MAPTSDTGVRLLVAGDKSHAGKSTVSLGLLVALLESGFQPSEIAYIKPATQCVSSTLTARFCKSAGIDYEHIGPVVFYHGFTREQQDISGEVAPNSIDADAPPPVSFPDQCAQAVDRISRGKKLTLIDGVGYPSVGSIIGCSSADVAIACRAPVLIVGRPGVGDAIDSFNLCATFFEAQQIPVIGGIFNKLQPTGFYGRDKCDEYVRKYMAANRPRQRVYGLLPTHESLTSMAAEESCGFAFKRPEQQPDAGELSADDEKAISAVSDLFKRYVNTRGLIDDLADASANPAAWARVLPSFPGSSASRSSKRGRND